MSRHARPWSDPAALPSSVAKGHGVCDQCNQTFDRVYLPVHAGAGAIKVGLSGAEHRVRKHTSRGYRLVAQWTAPDHPIALAAERAVLTRWREAGIGAVAGAPRDGRT